MLSRRAGDRRSWVGWPESKNSDEWWGGGCPSVYQAAVFRWEGGGRPAREPLRPRHPKKRDVQQGSLNKTLFPAHAIATCKLLK